METVRVDSLWFGHYCGDSTYRSPYEEVNIRKEHVVLNKAPSRVKVGRKAEMLDFDQLIHVSVDDKSIDGWDDQ